MSAPRPSPRCAISAKHSSPYAEQITESIVQLGFPGSPTCRGRRRLTARAGFSWLAMPHMCILRWADKASILVGRMQVAGLCTPDSLVRIFPLLKNARPVLLNLGAPGRFDITPWSDRIKLVYAKYDGPWELPALGLVSAPTAVLIRPDGYVAWVGDRTQPDLVASVSSQKPGRWRWELHAARRSALRVWLRCDGTGRDTSQPGQTWPVRQRRHTGLDSASRD